MIETTIAAIAVDIRVVPASPVTQNPHAGSALLPGQFRALLLHSFPQTS